MQFSLVLRAKEGGIDHVDARSRAALGIHRLIHRQSVGVTIQNPADPEGLSGKNLGV